VPRDHELGGVALDFDVASTLPHAQGLDRQQLAATRMLRHVGRGGQMVAIEIAHDLPAGFHLAVVTEEHVLLDDGSARSFLLDHLADRLEGVVSLLLRGLSASWNSRREDMPHILQFDDRIAYAGM